MPLASTDCTRRERTFEKSRPAEAFAVDAVVAVMFMHP
jgi:hypothetical protein